MNYLACEGVLTVNPDGSPVCDTAWTLLAAPTPFDPSTLDPVSLAQAFGVGFVLVGAVLAVCFAARAILSIIRG
jgi:hypothetical protein